MTGVRRLRRSVLAVLVAAGIVVAFGAVPALAQQGAGRGDDEQIVLHGELVVAEGDSVGTAVIFDGPALVAGTVDETLVVFNGDVEITGTVARDVVVFNGDVVVRDGGEIGGDLITRGTPNVEPGATIRGRERSVASGADLGALGLASRFAWWFAYSISTLLLGLVLLALAPKLDPLAAWAARERVGASLGIGLAVFLLIPIVAALLLATLVGIPLGLFLLLGLGLVYTVAYVVGAHAFGRRIVREPRSRYAAFLAGWGIARALAIIPVVGGIAWTLLTILGFGVVLVIRRGMQDAEKTEVATTPPAPLPAG